MPHQVRHRTAHSRRAGWRRPPAAALHVAVLVMDEHFRADVLASDDPEQIAALLNEGLAE